MLPGRLALSAGGWVFPRPPQCGTVRRTLPGAPRFLQPEFPHQILEWPLRLHVPKNRPPSTEAGYTLVVWRVKGILGRPGRLDLDVEQQTTVYSTP